MTKGTKTLPTATSIIDRDVWTYCFNGPTTKTTLIPGYSTEIDEAMKIVSVMKKNGFYFFMSNCFSSDARKNEVWVSFHREPKGIGNKSLARANQLPMAICLAALKALKAKVDYL